MVGRDENMLDNGHTDNDGLSPPYTLHIVLYALADVDLPLRRR